MDLAASKPEVILKDLVTNWVDERISTKLDGEPTDVAMVEAEPVPQKRACH